jgi:hypothetical protein
MLKIDICKDNAKGTTDIYLSDVNKDSLSSAKAVRIEFEPVEYGEWRKPFIELRSHEAHEFLRELFEALIAYGFQSPKNQQGELTATKYHLEDLRKLLRIEK